MASSLISEALLKEACAIDALPALSSPNNNGSILVRPNTNRTYCRSKQQLYCTCPSTLERVKAGVEKANADEHNNQ